MGAGPHLDEHARFEAFFPGSAADFLRLLGSWSIPFALLDAGDTILFWNRGATKFYGLVEDDVLGRPWAEVVSEPAFVPAPPAPGVRTRRYETRHRSAAGEELSVMVTRTELPSGDGTEGAFVLVTDLAEAKGLERKLGRRVAQLSIIREIGECLQSAMGLERILRTILVGATASQGLRFNRAFLLLVDERHGMLRGRDAIGPADAEEARRIWDRLAAGKRTLRDLVDEYEPQTDEEPKAQTIARQLSARLDDDTQFVIAALRADGTTRVVDGRGSGDPATERITETLGVDAFVAVPLRAEGRPVGLLLADNAITRRAITDEDVAILELLGFQAAQALQRARLTEELARQVESLEAATRELRRNQERLVRSERLSAVGEMAARVAHEIRNPLVAIGGFARSLLERPEGRDPATRESLEIIVNEVRRLETIVKEVLDFSVPAPPRIGSVALKQLASEALELLRWELNEAGVATRVEEAEGSPPAAADPDQLFQAIINLLRNAVHAMPQGGDLVVRLRGVPHGVEMEVADTGVGMPPEVLSRAAEAFYTTKTHGSGLGLTIASQIARDHAGELRIESRVGEGTTVTLRLPAATEATTDA
ncbi:MAG TPA: ATP-binding protein [Candidatus Polarisedimenticolaceae bacterium]|nr:ATP-binding protein [Candidatus Polarisedimenticolaceae bacterium]